VRRKGKQSGKPLNRGLSVGFPAKCNAMQRTGKQCSAEESKAVRVFGLLPVGFPLLTEEPFGLLLTNQEFLAWLCSKQKSK
jgi:hypothetical protein